MMSKWLPVAIVIFCLVGMLIFPIIAVGLALGGSNGGTECTPSSSDSGDPSTGGSQGKGGSVDGVPSKFIPLYQGAAAKYKLGEDGPSMLAGLHYSETNFSTNIATSGDYQGPMAHGVAYWDTYGVDGDGDGKKDIMNDADAIYAAAALLKEYGAPGDWLKALSSYKAGPANAAAGEGYAQIAIDFAKEHHVPADESAGGSGGGGSGGSSTASNCVCPSPATASAGSSALAGLLGATAHAASGGKPFLLGDSIGVGLEPELSGFTVEATGAITLPSSFTQADARKDDIRNASAIVIELGTNKTDNFEADAKKMVQKVKSYNSSAPVYWVEIFSHGEGLYADYSKENKAIANLPDVTVIKTIDKNISLQSDNIHPDTDGYKKLAAVIETAVKNGPSGSSGGGSATTGGQNCQSSGGGGGGGSAGGTVSGSVQELAKKILASNNADFTFDTVSPNGSTEQVLKDVASGKSFYTTCPEFPKKQVDINPNILKFLVEALQKGPVGINAITDKCHTSGSPHYSGTAVDLEDTIGSLDTFISIAQKYGGTKNSETGHHHFDFPK